MTVRPEGSPVVLGAAAVVVVCSALGTPRTTAGVGRAVHRICDAIDGDKPGWLAEALASLDVRYSASDKWSSTALHEALQTGLALDWLFVRNGRFGCTSHADSDLSEFPKLTSAEASALSNLGATVLHQVR